MRKAAIVLFFLGFLLTGGVTAWADTPGSYGACADAYRPLFLTQPNLSGSDVAELQKRLHSLGYYPSPVHGVYDSATAEAVKRLQKAMGVAATGKADQNIYTLLGGGEPDRPASGNKVTTPPGKPSIFIDTTKHTLTVMYNGEPFKKYPVCVGTEETPTPIGEWQVEYKGSDWGDGFGTRWMGLNVPWGIFGIHGTNKPWSIGGAESHGCIRMFNRDVEELYSYIPVGTPVKIVGKPDFPPDAPSSRKMKTGMIGPDVVLVQLRLKEMGLYWSSADGRYGSLTAVAVKYWQNLANLPETGQISLKDIPPIDSSRQNQTIQ